MKSDHSTMSTISFIILQWLPNLLSPVWYNMSISCPSHPTSLTSSPITFQLTLQYFCYPILYTFSRTFQACSTSWAFPPTASSALMTDFPRCLHELLSHVLQFSVIMWLFREASLDHSLYTLNHLLNCLSFCLCFIFLQSTHHNLLVFICLFIVCLPLLDCSIKTRTLLFTTVYQYLPHSTCLINVLWINDWISLHCITYVNCINNTYVDCKWCSLHSLNGLVFFCLNLIFK